MVAVAMVPAGVVKEVVVFLILFSLPASQVVGAAEEVEPVV